MNQKSITENLIPHMRLSNRLHAPVNVTCRPMRMSQKHRPSLAKSYNSETRDGSSRNDSDSRSGKYQPQYFTCESRWEFHLLTGKLKVGDSAPLPPHGGALERDLTDPVSGDNRGLWLWIKAVVLKAEEHTKSNTHQVTWGFWQQGLNSVSFHCFCFTA